MTINAQATMDRARKLIQDETSVRWPLPELRLWINDAVREIALLKPTAVATLVAMPLAQGTYQKLPDGYTRILRVVRNLRSMQEAPRLAGKIIRTTDREMLDSTCPDWHDERIVRQTDIVQNIVYDDSDPTGFFVYPGNTGNGFIEAVVGQIPAEIPAPASGTENDIASYDFVIALQDLYTNAILDYVVYRAYSKDAQFAGSAQRAAAYYSQFSAAINASIASEQALGLNIKSQGDNAA